MGVAGGLNDRSAIPGNVKSFYPNSFGLFNMSGNVSEWVADVYRPLTPSDGEDFNYFRGNKFQKFYKNSAGEFERDSSGRLKKVDVSDEEVKNRRNYQHNNALGYLDGDSLSASFYETGVTTLVGDKSRVFKGGSWNDRPYWLSPGHAGTSMRNSLQVLLASVVPKLIWARLKARDLKKGIFLVNAARIAEKKVNNLNHNKNLHPFG